jgi:GH43 family beta-xylosidase
MKTFKELILNEAAGPNITWSTQRSIQVIRSKDHQYTWELSYINDKESKVVLTKSTKSFASLDAAAKDAMKSVKKIFGKNELKYSNLPASYVKSLMSEEVKE